MVKEPRTDDLDPRMDILRGHMLGKPGAVDEFPFGPQAMVYISLKCDPDRAIELREQHPGITGAYHMNKKHWNSVKLDDSVSLELVRELMDHSYDLVVASLPKKVRLRNSFTS